MRPGQIPRWALVHTIAVEPFLGSTAMGPAYGAAVTHRALVQDHRKLIRTPTGREVVTSLSCHLSPGAQVPEESRVHVRGRVATAVQVLIRDGGGLPTPDHVLVLCE